MRKFEIISNNQWGTDLGRDIDYTIKNGFHLPVRGTKHSAGYDFVSPIDITIPGHSTATIPTGVKVKMNDDDVLIIAPRSSMGFKTTIRLANTIGIIDSDYYNNENNEGHIFIKFYNPTEQNYDIKIGDKIAQGIFINYLTTDEEEDISSTRSGGIGSTGK